MTPCGGTDRLARVTPGCHPRNDGARQKARQHGDLRRISEKFSDATARRLFFFARDVARLPTPAPAARERGREVGPPREAMRVPSVRFGNVEIK